MTRCSALKRGFNLYKIHNTLDNVAKLGLSVNRVKSSHALYITFIFYDSHNACRAVFISDNRYPKPSCPVSSGNCQWIISTYWRYVQFFVLKTFLSCSGGPPCTCTFGQHINVLKSKPPGGHGAGELVAAHSQYSHLVTSTVCIIEGCLYARGSQSDCWFSVQELDTSWRVEAPPGCSSGHLAEVLYGGSRSICFGKHNSLHVVVCPGGGVQSIEATLSHDWPDCLLYAFPQIPLLWETLHRISQGRNRVILIVPLWLSKPLIPLLLTLFVGRPKELSFRRDLLFQLDRVAKKGPPLSKQWLSQWVVEVIALA